MIYWIVAFCLGAIAVLQGGLNRQIAKDWGLSVAIFLNSSILLLIALAFGLICYFNSQNIPEVFQPKWNSTAWRTWYVIPAICGFSLVAGIPALIPKLGAVGVFLSIVVGQMAFSLLWDLKIEQLPLEPRRAVGVGLALIGLLISYWKNPFAS